MPERMRVTGSLSVAVLLCAAIAFAAAPRKVTIKKRGGEIVKGTVVSEMDTGYLIKPEGKGSRAVTVKYEDVADLAEGDAPLAALPPPPPPAAPVASPAGQPPPPPPPPPATGAGVAAAPPAYLNAPPPPVSAAQPCAANEVYVQFGEHDDVAGAVCATRTEVTVAEYQVCVNARYCNAENLRCGDAPNWGQPDRASHPINCVTAAQAEAYCTWRQSRLPTLLEFQALARRADGEGEFPWGGDDPTGRVCWSGEGRGRRGTCQVGTYPRGAGRSGVLDIAGNVWEWTATKKRNDRVFAGGAWNDSNHGRMETTSENRDGHEVHFDDVGFRCIRAVR